MAFAGMMMVGVILLLLCGFVAAGIIMLISGIVLRAKRHKKSSGILFIISGIMLGMVLVFVLLAVMPKSEKVPTPAGDVVIRPSWIGKYEECLKTHNLEELKALVDTHPDMIYYYDVNHVMLLDYGLVNCDIDIMQIALDKGAKFDDPLRYDYMVFYSSFDAFFPELNYPEWEKSSEELILEGETTDEMIQATAFAIEHGAKLKWEINPEHETNNFFDKAANWVAVDGIISETDEAFLKMIAESDPEMMELYNNWKQEKNR